MQIYILLTENCNLNCAMCIRGRQQGTNIDLNALQEFSWLEELAGHDVVITGGEPSLHPQFSHIVHLFCGYAKTVTITSNGTINNYLTKNFLRPNLFFQISLDGDLAAHDGIRGKNVYNRSFETLRILDRLGAQFSVATVASRKNKNSLLNLEMELHKLKGLQYWKIAYEMPFGDADAEHMMPAEEWNRFVDYMLEYVSLRMKIKKIFPFELYDAHREELEQQRKGSKRSFNCGSGTNKLYLYPDLTVYSCTCLTDFPLGNLKENTLQEILNSEPIRKFVNYRVLDDSICSKCEYVKFCNGGCIGMSYHFFGKLGMGDMRCPKIKENEKKDFLL